ncbi:MAG: 3-oxoacyl-[acyl-carrier-protein] reductase [Nitrospirae bacterium RBG_13_43_8]|nr:MAG: 3-oxoacyl-[acyl-carrier-protein] reductase [Nitrospirae bacterium RBG_13_43_8]
MLKDKLSIITGAGRGIGKAIALRFAEEGSNIAICDVDPNFLEEVKKEIEAKGREVLAKKVDVTNFEIMQDFVQKVLDKFGKIDILINNAGITRDGLIVRMNDADWDAVLDVNLKGTFNCTKAAIKTMMKQRAGKIVNVASVIGIVGNAGQANYAASKGGVIAFTKSVAKELASRNINVNAIAPGFIQTHMTASLSEDIKNEIIKQIPLGRWGNAEDVANIALFLVSDASAYITGQVIQVDGGMVT